MLDTLGTPSNVRRQKAEEEVVQRQRCVGEPPNSPSLLRYKLSKCWKTNCVILYHSCLSVKDKSNHAVVLDKATSDKLYKDVQSYRLITVATLVDRLKINGSLARKALAELEQKGQIKKVVGHSKMNIYSMFLLIQFFASLLCNLGIWISLLTALGSSGDSGVRSGFVEQSFHLPFLMDDGDVLCGNK